MSRSFKSKKEICRFCQDPFMTGGNGKQTVCFKPECRHKLYREWKQRGLIRKKARKITPIDSKRLCLKCDRPIHVGHLCDSCKRENSEYYEEVWGTSCSFKRR